MLPDIFCSKPDPRFVLIQDTVEYKQNALLEAIINIHTNQPHRQVHIFSHENQIKCDKNHPQITFHNMPIGIRTPICIRTAENVKILPLKESVQGKNVFIIDSLADLVYTFGEAICIQEIQRLLSDEAILQVVAVLHTDLFEDNQIPKLFAYISALNIVLQDNDVVEYTFKKVNGKVIKKEEEITYENGNMRAKDIKKEVVKQRIEPVIEPDKLSTFKISLEETEIQSRSKLVLPYLRSATTQGKPLVSIGDSTQPGRIIYMPDDNDDIDDEDPDDDLDI